MNHTHIIIAILLAIFAIIFELASWGEYPKPEELTKLLTSNPTKLNEKQMNVQKYHNMAVVLGLLAIVSCSCKFSFGKESNKSE